MSSNYLLDSSAWIEYFSGTTKGQKLIPLIEKQEVSTSIIAIAELADKFARENKEFDKVLEFIESRAGILPLTIGITLSAASLKKIIRQRNTKFGLADALHLATAIEHEAILVTSDHDFSGERNVLLL
ncbi:PIN domain-containing protein [Candidatus Woesearchaeota archaeon]|nr:PIN domain-containing protein [Candidatus Woesearchaeota archaeon]